MTEGGPGGASHILSTYIFERAFKFLDYGYGASLSVVMMIIAMICSLVVIIYASKRGFLNESA
jgi:ABC-type sugar transport system permease subunit